MKKRIFIDITVCLMLLFSTQACDSSNDSDIIRWSGTNEFPNIRVFVGDEEQGAVERKFGDQNEDFVKRDSTILSKKDIPNMIKRHFKTNFNQNQYASFMLEFKDDKAMYVIQDTVDTNDKSQVIAPYSIEKDILSVKVGGEDVYVAHIDEKANNYYRIETMCKYIKESIVGNEIVKENDIVYVHEDMEYEAMRVKIEEKAFTDLRNVKDTIIFTNVKYIFK